MTTQTEDLQFTLMTILGASMGLRIIATIVGVAPWSGWITIAMVATVLAFSVWLKYLELE